MEKYRKELIKNLNEKLNENNFGRVLEEIYNTDLREVIFDYCYLSGFLEEVADMLNLNTFEGCFDNIETLNELRKARYFNYFLIDDYGRFIGGFDSFEEVAEELNIRQQYLLDEIELNIEDLDKWDCEAIEQALNEGVN